MELGDVAALLNGSGEGLKSVCWRSPRACRCGHNDIQSLLGAGLIWNFDREAGVGIERETSSLGALGGCGDGDSFIRRSLSCDDPDNYCESRDAVVLVGTSVIETPGRVYKFPGELWQARQMRG